MMSFVSGLTSCVDAAAKKLQAILDQRKRQIDSLLKRLQIESREGMGQAHSQILRYGV